MHTRCQPFGNYKSPKHVFVIDQPTNYDVTYAKSAGSSVGKQLLHLLISSLQFSWDDCLIIHCARDNRPTRSVADLRKEFAEFVKPWISKSSVKHVIFCGNQAACGAGFLEGLEGVTKLESKVKKVATNNGNVRAACVSSLYVLKRTPSMIESYVLSIARSLKLIKPEKFICEPVDICRKSDMEDMLHEYWNAEGIHRKVAYDHETTGLAIFDRQNESVAKSVMTSYFNGVKTDDGVCHPYVWAPYDKCGPRFAKKFKKWVNAELKQFHIEMNRPSKRSAGYGFWAHNRIFDDPISLHTFKLPKVYWSEKDGRFLSWSYNSGSPNGLKALAELLFGVREYDKPVTDMVKEIVARRKGDLCEDDLRALKFINKKPVVKEYKNGTKKLLWPAKEVSKMETSYACVPLDTLMTYCGFDTIYTWFGIVELEERLKEADKDLYRSAIWKHRFAESLHEAQMWGMDTDVEFIELCSKQLELIEEAMLSKMRRFVEKNHADLTDIFNPNSDNQLRKIIFGEPSTVPKLVFAKEEQEVYTEVGSKKKVERLLSEAHTAVLARPSIIEAIRNDELNEKHFVKQVKQELMENFGRAVDRLKMDSAKVYLKGETRPQVFTKKSGEPSVNKEVLNLLTADRPSKFLASLMFYKRASKLRSTFLDGVKKLCVFNAETGLFESHGIINPIGTISGRPSGSKPNDLNRPKKARGIHRARPGFALFEFDFSQIELRVASCLSGDKALREACLAGDLHAQTAVFMFNLKSLEEVDKILHRQPAKIMNFSVIYGVSPFRLALFLSTPEKPVTVEEAEKLINDKYFAAYPDLKGWIDEQHEAAQNAPWYVRTPFGTRFSTIDALSSEAEVKSHALRQAVNVQVQGGASEVAQCSIYRIRKEAKKRKWNVHFVSHVYDSAAFEVPYEMVPKHILEHEDFAEGTVSVSSPEDIGEFGQLCLEVVKRPYPASILDGIEYKIDMTYSTYWDGKADMAKAIDPEKGKAKEMAAWAFIDPSILDAKDRKELERLEVKAYLG